MKIDYVVGPDWEAVYIDGDKVAEEYNITVRQLLDGLAYKTGQACTRHYADSEWFETNREFPDKFKDVLINE